jgi:hypothetical protein
MLKHELTNLHTQGPLADLAYLRPDQVPRRYPFSRALVYQLLNSGDIKSILVRKRGSVRGIRLVSVASIEAYLARLAKEQKDEGFARVVAKEFNKGRSPRPKPVLASTGQKGNGKRGRPRKEGVVA